MLRGNCLVEDEQQDVPSNKKNWNVSMNVRHPLFAKLLTLQLTTWVNSAVHLHQCDQIKIAKCL